MKTSEPWYLTERAEQMAKMVLTRNGGVAVAHNPHDEGIDLLVTLTTASHAGRMFGIKVKGSTDIRTLFTRDGTLHKSVAKKWATGLNDYPFPVAMMVFDMQTDSGYWGWILAPDTSTGTLRKPCTLRVEPAQNHMIQKAIQDVGAWYDARRRACMASWCTPPAQHG